jgi:putative FmdB family regulatory protein
MPNYTYRCQNCQKGFSIELSYQEYEKANVTCPHCQSKKVERRLSRVRFARSEESRLESLADPAALEAMEEDPKAMAQMMRQMSSEMGEDLGPEFNDVVRRLESGESPEQIEKDLPDLGGGDLDADE